MEQNTIVLHIPTTGKFPSMNKLNRKLVVLTCLSVGEFPNGDINRPGHGRQSTDVQHARAADVLVFFGYFRNLP